MTLCFSIGVTGNFKGERKLEKIGKHGGRRGKGVHHVYGLQARVSGASSYMPTSGQFLVWTY